MSAGLKVKTPGAHTTVQDYGRFGFQHMGVPVSGALDTQSLRLANVLVGNAPDEAGLEILHFGPTFEVTADSVCVALGAIGARIEIIGEQAKEVPAWQSLVLLQGQVFKITLLPYALSCYLTIAGGFDLPKSMGSLSTYVRSGIGGFEGRTLRADDELAIVYTDWVGTECYCFRQKPKELTAPPASVVAIRVTWGAQKDFFSQASLKQFQKSSYTIEPESDRMGFRISGERLKFRDKPDIVSDGIATGAIQVPGDGQPIVLLADHQTTGGYPKIATVISADLGVIGRLRPGQKISFCIVGIEEAERLARDQEKELQSLEENIQLLGPSSEVNVDALWSQNLISGIFNAFN